MQTRKMCSVAAAATLAFISQLAASIQSQAQEGIASFYNLPLKKASGEKLSSADLTAAHRTLPLGSRVLVTNLRTGKTIIVLINDRGPYVKGRIIDLSKAAARSIGISGVGRVRVSPLSR